MESVVLPRARTAKNAADKTTAARRAARAKPAKPYDGFPLFPHATGRWAKKIGGRFAFFGPWNDPFGALARFTAQRDALYAERLGPGRTVAPHAAHDAPRPAPHTPGRHAPHPPSSRPAANVAQRARPAPAQELSLDAPASETLTVRGMVNHFLTAKQRKMASGELGRRVFNDYYAVCGRMVASLGPDRAVGTLTPADFSALRDERARRFGPVVLGIEIGRVRTVFKHAYENGLRAGLASILITQLEDLHGRFPADLVSRAHAAEIAITDPKTISRWIAAGRLPAYGKSKLVSVSELQSLLPGLRQRQRRTKSKKSDRRNSDIARS